MTILTAKFRVFVFLLSTLSFLGSVPLGHEFSIGANGYTNWPAKTGTVSGSLGNLGFYGTAIESQWGGGPQTDSHPQYYFGIEATTLPTYTYTVNGHLYGFTYDITNLQISVSGTDPSGAAISHLDFPNSNLAVYHGPDTNPANYESIAGFLYGQISAVLPGDYNALLTSIENALSFTSSTPPSTGNTANGVYGDWTLCSKIGGAYDPYCYGNAPESSLIFGLQFDPGGSLPGTWTINVDFHIEASICSLDFSVSPTPCARELQTSDMTDTIYYCFQTCSSDATISSSQSSVSVTPISSATSTITVGSLNSFSGSVSLSGTASDASIQSALSSPWITISPGGSGSSNLVISAPATTCRAGIFSVTIYVGNGLAGSVTISITESCPSFSISASPSTYCLYPGFSAGFSATIQGLNGFSGTAMLSETISPSSSQDIGQLTLPSVGNPITISVPAGGSTTARYYVQDLHDVYFYGDLTVTVTATAGSLQRSASSSVHVDFVCGYPTGGSVASGTLITLSNGKNVPVQDLHVGMQLLSYDMTSSQYTTIRITRFAIVETNNLLIIHTATGRPLMTDRNPAQRLEAMFPNGTFAELPVTELKVGYYLFDALTLTWLQVTNIQYVNGGVHTMYDIYTNAPILNYIANSYLDYVKS